MSPPCSTAERCKEFLEMWFVGKKLHPWWCAFEGDLWTPSPFLPFFTLWTHELFGLTLLHVNCPDETETADPSKLFLLFKLLAPDGQHSNRKFADTVCILRSEAEWGMESRGGYPMEQNCSSEMQEKWKNGQGERRLLCYCLATIGKRNHGCLNKNYYVRKEFALFTLFCQKGKTWTYF